ncbi:MAG: sigma factor-like helix-turn-helix DNA-binding protein [Solirubrobacteraceae bacterium]
MDELIEFCARMLGDRDAGAAVARSAREAGGEDELATLVDALKQCRARTSGESLPQLDRAQDGGELSAAVAAELSAATARLPPRQREALALRELLRLSHGELSLVLGIDAAAAAPLLARSRLRLRAELRGAPAARSDCAERERMLRVATLRQDGEQVAIVDDDWLVDHLGHCEDCIRAHAAMLEGSACYRGWRRPADPAALAAEATS